MAEIPQLVRDGAGFHPGRLEALPAPLPFETSTQVDLRSGMNLFADKAQTSSF